MSAGRAARRRAAVVRRRLAEARGDVGVLPDTLIIGAQKGGTTSLYRYLSAHPDVFVSDVVEVHHFDDAYDTGLDAYRRHFPHTSVVAALEAEGRRPAVVEKSPKYLFHPRVAARVAGALPSARCVALLRDPVERAISHHAMNVRQGVEPLSLAEAIDAEEDRIGDDLARIAAGEIEMGLGPAARFSYVARGLYADQFDRWVSAFPDAQIFVARSEDLWQAPDVTYTRLLDFLGLSSHTPEFRVWHQGTERRGLDPGVRRELRARFEAPGERLYERWGIGWQ